MLAPRALPLQRKEHVEVDGGATKLDRMDRLPLAASRN